MIHPPADDELGHGDIEAALATRRELGARYDAELVDGFAERIERAVDHRVSEQVALQQRRTAAVAGAGARQLALGIISLVAFIPISIALGLNGEFLALLVTLAGIVGVNLTHAWQSRRP
ncbi:hypothetical protein [Nocardioides sp. Soil805]|uniref:hypothetical protein n=1 Tax=Nocardioides sp. Soil805 TaxID=1736416 RepID=UPI000702D5EA|nr:hypothetical protein [Nocardioides sp. Soil805]KRF32334.1 hypothetical protein ASG94_17835 [Nocardioides sp. Soil805]